jgi:hypothetical protein
LPSDIVPADGQRPFVVRAGRSTPLRFVDAGFPAKSASNQAMKGNEGRAAFWVSTAGNAAIAFRAGQSQPRPNVNRFEADIVLILSSRCHGQRYSFGPFAYWHVGNDQAKPNESK